MTTITIDQMQKDVKGLLQRVKAGETLVILEADQPVAEIKPVESQEAGLRPYGLCAGAFRVPDDFDAPLSEDILASFV